MTLSFANPPGDAWNALVSGLAVVRHAQSNTAGGGGPLAMAAAPSAMHPHPVYSLGLFDLEAGKGLEAARLVAWRYLLVDQATVTHAVEVITGPTGQSKFGSLTNGFVGGVAQAFTLAESLPEVQHGNYEIRTLRVPGLHVMALWLKDLQGAADRFIVLPPTFPPLQPLLVYSSTDFLAILTQLAIVQAPQERQVKPPTP